MIPPPTLLPIAFPAFKSNGGWPPQPTESDSTATKEARREKAKENARRNRQKKKNEFESLHTEERRLREENQRLRAVVRARIPDQAQRIVSDCCYTEDSVKHLNPYTKIPNEEGSDENQGDFSLPATATLNQNDFDLIESLAAGRQSFVLTDPRMADNPIVYCSDSFCETTGYKREQVIGRNCRFLQSPETDQKAVANLRSAIEKGRDMTTVVLNVKADGTTFWNRIFIAALRDRHNRIVNYLGVQSPCSDPRHKKSGDIPIAEVTEKSDIKRIPDPVFSMAEPNSLDLENDLSIEPAAIGDEEDLGYLDSQTILGVDDDLDDSDLGQLDWAILAESLESGYKDCEGKDKKKKLRHWGDRWIELEENHDDTSEMEAQITKFANHPRLFTTRVIRSEVITALLSSYGDTSNDRFTSALSVLSTVYMMAGINSCSKEIYSRVLDGNWRSLSRPVYKGCRGMKSDGSFCYNLGTMSFGMFRPEDLVCSVSNTLSTISTASQDGSPIVAPWSLRRELAAHDEDGNDTKHSLLKSYDISVSLTIEPEAAPDSAVNKRATLRDPIPALQTVKGFALPDPKVPNRITIWFVGGSLCPASAAASDDLREGDTSSKSDKQDNLNGWKELFGAEQKKTWGESFRDIGAKLLLGAEIPGMATDGSLSYTLHRPHGGHGVAFIDILYLDESVLVTRGNKGTIYVMARDNGLASSASSPVMDTVAEAIEDPGLKRKRFSLDSKNKPKRSQLPKKAKYNVQRNDNRSDALMTPEFIPLPVTPNGDENERSASFFDFASFVPPEDTPPLENPSTVFSQAQQSDGGVKTILQSVEAFFSHG